MFFGSYISDTALGVEPAACRAYEDAESGLRSAYSAGMQTIDVTYMEGYPLPTALRKAKAEQVAQRTWVSEAQLYIDTI